MPPPQKPPRAESGLVGKVLWYKTTYVVHVWMCVCVCVCVYVSTCIYECVCVCVCVYLCVSEWGWERGKDYYDDYIIQSAEPQNPLQSSNLAQLIDHYNKRVQVSTASNGDAPPIPPKRKTGTTNKRVNILYK